MSSGIFLIQDDESLVQMTEAPYDTEDLLQGLLEKYPSLLAGDQMGSSEPRRWLLIRREVGVADSESGSNRWSIDHLFLDQDAIPTLIEVKRSSDTRIRREVVGQMLDYAANGVVYWRIDQLRDIFERNCESVGKDPQEALVEFLGGDGDIDDFWQKAKTNLQAGRVRMVFVADVIPNELKRIVEFLNEQMDPAEVLAVEIKQYITKDSGLRSLVPRVVGQTAEAEKRKGVGRQSQSWDEPLFFQTIEDRNGQEIATVAKQLYDWARTKTDRFRWGKGSQDGSVYPVIGEEHEKKRLFILYTNGRIEIPFNPMGDSISFSDKSMRLQLLNRINAIAGINLPEDAVEKWPRFDMKALVDENALSQFLLAMEWTLQQHQRPE